MSELKRELGLGYATLFGVGLILGAGIYVLIGRAAAMVGDAVWTSVAFSAVIALATAFSYAELSSMFPSAASTHTYVREAFPQRSLLALLSGWMLFFGGVAGAATASLGFAGYFCRLLNLGETWFVPVSIALLTLLSFINWWGIRESAMLSAVFTFIEAGGLILVSALGLFFYVREPNYYQFNPRADPLTAMMVGAAIFYFAYTGFEYQPTLSEETKDPEKVIPKSIILAVAVTTAIYLLVSVSVVRLMSWEELGSSSAPMADAAARAWPQSFHLLMAIALFATTNTVLGFLVSSSRLAYGLAKEGVIWRGLARVDEWRRTPHVSAFLSGTTAIAVVLLTEYLPSATGWRLAFGDREYELIDLVGKTSSLAVLLAFILVNAAVVYLRIRKHSNVRYFKIPLNVKNIPLLPILANVLIVLFIALSFNDWIVWLSTVSVVALGVALHKKRG
ncbi:MAG: APC family permease [Thermofilaceae archaeon]|nr:APC family permease [Thermofilaceae archaeon]MCX8180976.1 APC family permease [Thermofilaceae archaeon]MDW8004081.1 APC family permease [Thermofilaceae archaeon]